MDYIHCLAFSKAGYFGQSLEKFATFNKFWYNIVIFIILDQIYYSDNVWVTLFPKNGEFILKQLNINLLFLYCSFLHDFDCEGFSAVLVHTKSDDSKCTLSEGFTKSISIFNVPYFLELLVVIDMESSLFYNLHIS